MADYKKIIRPIDIRFRDIDAMGHVNNAVYFTYFEEARKVFLEKVLGVVNPSDYPFIMARIHCEYRIPLRLGTRPAVEVWIKEIGSRKFTFRYRLADLEDASLEYGTGESIMVFYDYEGGRSVPIPDDVRKRLASFLE